MKVYRLTSVVVVKANEGLIIQASGLSATAGWSGLELQVDDPNPGDRILEYGFEGKPPSGISIQVLTPVSASTVVAADNVDGILVKSRTNSIEVHASDFQSASRPVTTFALGEEGPLPTTLRLGEEDPPTTWRIGEEGFPSTLFVGEENPTTERFGEEEFSTLRFGEEGPLGTDVRVDDPAIFSSGSDLTTLAVGEEGSPVPDPRRFGRTPFGGF